MRNCVGFLQIRSHIVGVCITSLTDVLAVLFVQSNSMMATLFNEIMDLDYQHAEISTIPPATATSAVINTAANTVAPPVTLHTDAGGHPLPAEASGPKTRSPYDHSSLSANLLITPTKLSSSSSFLT